MVRQVYTQLPQSSCCKQSVLIAPRVNEFSVHICDHCYNPLPTGYCETLDSYFVSAKWTDSNNSTYSGKAVADQQQLMLKVFLIIIMRLINNNNNYRLRFPATCMSIYICAGVTCWLSRDV